MRGIRAADRKAITAAHMARKRQRFGRLLAKGVLPAEAYCRITGRSQAAAGTVASWVRHPEVVAEVERLEGMAQVRVAEVRAITLDTIYSELEEARLLALASEQSSAAVQASLCKAKLAGLLVDRRQELASIPAPATDDEIAARIRELLAQDSGLRGALQ